MSVDGAERGEVGPTAREEILLEVAGDVEDFDRLVEACEGAAAELLGKDPTLAYAVAVAVLQRVAARVDDGGPDSEEELGSVFIAQRAIVLDATLDKLLRGGVAR